MHQRSSPLSSQACHFAAKSRGNNRITLPVRFNVIGAGYGKGEGGESVPSVQISPPAHYVHTPCFVHGTTVAIYMYIKRLLRLYCS